jgi:hypothetical protein
MCRPAFKRELAGRSSDDVITNFAFHPFQAFSIGTDFLVFQKNPGSSAMLIWALVSCLMCQVVILAAQGAGNSNSQGELIYFSHATELKYQVVDLKHMSCNPYPHLMSRRIIWITGRSHLVAG